MPLLLLAVVLVVVVDSSVLGLSSGLVTVQVVQALGLEQLVNLATGNASKQLLGKRMAHGLAFSPLSVFKELGCLERSGTGKQFVRELTFVLSSVHLFVVLLMIFAESKHFVVVVVVVVVLTNCCQVVDNCPLFIPPPKLKITWPFETVVHEICRHSQIPQYVMVAWVQCSGAVAK